MSSLARVVLARPAGRGNNAVVKRTQKMDAQYAKCSNASNDRPLQYHQSIHFQCSARSDQIPSSTAYCPLFRNSSIGSMFLRQIFPRPIRSTSPAKQNPSATTTTPPMRHTSFLRCLRRCWNCRSCCSLATCLSCCRLTSSLALARANGSRVLCTSREMAFRAISEKVGKATRPPPPPPTMAATAVPPPLCCTDMVLLLPLLPPSTVE